MAINSWELRSDLSWKDAVSSTQGITRSSVNHLRRLMAWSRFLKKLKIISKHFHDILRFKYMKNTFVGNFFFGFDIFLSHCFCLHFRLLNHFEIIRWIVKSFIATLTYFLFKYKWKSKILKSVISVPEFCLPNQYTSLPNGQDTSLHISVKHTSQRLIP